MHDDPAADTRPGLLLPAFRLVLAHRGLVVAGCGLVTLLAILSASRLVVASSIGKLFLDEVPAYAVYGDRMATFGSDELFVVAYEEPDLLAPVAVDKLRRVVARTEAHPQVSRVLSLLDALRFSDEDGVLRIDHYVDLAREGDPSATLTALLADDRYRGTLVAKDGRAAAIVVELTVDPHRPAEKGPLLVGKVVDELVAVGYERARIHRGGITAVIAEVMAESHRSISLLFPLSSLALLAMVLLLFRRLAPALMAMGVGAISVIWTLGFAAVLDRDFSIFMALVPALVLTVAFSDIVHLWSAYLLELREGRSKRDAILATSREVGAACLLTSVTTGVGFLSLSAIPTPVSRQLGLVLGFGVGVALLLAVTLVPIALSWMSTPPLESTQRVHRSLDRGLAWVADLSTRRAGWVLAAFALLLVPLGVGAARFEMEADFSDRFADDSPFAREQRFLADHFSGTNTVDLFIEAPKPGGLLDATLVRRIAELQDTIQARGEVDEVVSAIDVFRDLHQALRGPEQRGDLPTAPGALAQYLLVLEMTEGGESPGAGLESLIDFERQTMRLSMRLPDQGFRETGRVGLALQEQARAHLGDAATVEVTGMVFLLGSSFNVMVEGQQRALLLSLLAIAVLMVLGLRSASVGVLSMLPNLMPLAALLAYAGLRWDQVDTDICIVAVMAIGIGVDDTIHFLMRYRVETARERALHGGNPGAVSAAALRRTYAFAGRGIVMTTLILSAGFMPFALSDYFSVNMLGTALPGVLVVALVADLFLVPAMARVGLLRF